MWNQACVKPGMVGCADGPTTEEAEPERSLSPDVWSQPVISVFGSLRRIYYKLGLHDEFSGLLGLYDKTLCY